MTGLPDGWVMATLNEVLEPQARGRLLEQGWSPQCLKEASEDSTVWGVLKTTAIQPGSFLAEHNKRLPDHLDPRPGIEVQVGDLLLTCAGPRSRCGIPTLVRNTRPRLMISGKMYRFRAKASVMEPTFLEKYLLSPLAQRAIDDMKTGVSDSGLNLTHERFLRLEVPVPPLDEQRRIVAILEDHLSRLDAGLRSTGSVRRLTPLLLRQALTARIDNVVADRRPLGELVREGMRNGHSARASLDGTGIRTLTLTAVTKGEFTDANSKLTVADKDRVQDLWLEPGDIFVERANTPELVGTSALYRGLTGWAIFPDLLIRVRADTSVVSPEYLGLVLQSPESCQFLRDRAKGLAGSMPKIDQGTLAQLPVPVPSLVEQTQVVGFMESLIEKCKRIDGLATTVEAHGNLLRKSLMIAAFSGQLTKESFSV